MTEVGTVTNCWTWGLDGKTPNPLFVHVTSHTHNPVFRVHFAGEPHFDVSAPNVAIARDKAAKARPGAFITKVKLVKGD